MSTVTTIKSCATTTCAFNHDGCTAFAITVDGEAACSTFISLDAHVGACQRLECAHNSDLMCTAEAISISQDKAACLSYKAR